MLGQSMSLGHSGEPGDRFDIAHMHRCGPPRSTLWSCATSRRNARWTANPPWGWALQGCMRRRSEQRKDLTACCGWAPGMG